MLCMPIPGACIGICPICLLLPEVETRFFYSETLVSSRCHTFELMVSAFGKPMQLLGGEIDRFRGLTVYVRDGFSAYRQRSY